MRKRLLAIALVLLAGALLFPRRDLPPIYSAHTLPVAVDELLLTNPD